MQFFLQVQQLIIEEAKITAEILFQLLLPDDDNDNDNNNNEKSRYKRHQEDDGELIQVE